MKQYQQDKKIQMLIFLRGIDVVRNRIKMFAQQKINLKTGNHKIIILDEADKFFFFFFKMTN